MKKVMGSLLVVIILFLAWSYGIPQKTEVEKTLYCWEEVSGKDVAVTITGVYEAYLLKDDVFEGTIAIEGIGTYTRKYRLRQDTYTNFVDEMGQPKGGILQFGKFSYISMGDDNFSISSTWNPQWQEAFEKTLAWNVTLERVKDILWRNKYSKIVWLLLLLAVCVSWGRKKGNRRAKE